MAKCKVCGAPHKACGPASTVIPVDQRITEGGSTVGLKKYQISVPRRGGDVVTTVKLSDEDAKRLGAKPVDVTESKARTPRNKAAKPAADK